MENEEGAEEEEEEEEPEEVESDSDMEEQSIDGIRDKDAEMYDDRADKTDDEDEDMEAAMMGHQCCEEYDKYRFIMRVLVYCEKRILTPNSFSAINKQKIGTCPICFARPTYV